MSAQPNRADWRDAAPCRGKWAEHFPNKPGKRGHELAEAARLRCLGCPVMELCLAVTLTDELHQPAEMRHGIAGGSRPAERAELELKLGPDAIRRAVADELDRWETGRAVRVPWPPPAAATFRRRKCAVCGEPFRQPKAGRPALYCPGRCQRLADYRRHHETRLEAKRREWSELEEPERERRRQAMRARWANLSPEARRAQYDAKAARRRRAREGSPLARES